ncbi:MAG: protein-L-isoaspartate O-methyltransferase family protein [Gammaproteobacteria bacterium]
MKTIDEHREFYASFVTATMAVYDKRIERAFASVAREQFLGQGPWKISVADGYIETPSADPAYVYQDVVVALRSDKRINNGQPTLHAKCLDAADVRAGDRILHVGCGSGYYSALLSQLTADTGTVHAWDLDPVLAEKARCNLDPFDNVVVECRSGSMGGLPESDVIYVSAGSTRPMRVWIDALSPGGRLVFPLTPGWGRGGILKITREADELKASFVLPCQFIPCDGGRDPETELRLAEAFERGGTESVCSLHFGVPAANSRCWFQGRDWWLSA